MAKYVPAFYNGLMGHLGASLSLGARTLLGAPGLTTRSKKLLGTKGIATRSKDATRAYDGLMGHLGASYKAKRTTGKRIKRSAGYALTSNI